MAKKRRSDRGKATDQQVVEQKARAEKPKRATPVWLKRAVCFAASVFLMFCAIYMLFVMVIGARGVAIGIVGVIVFTTMAIHMFRAGLTDGQWRVERERPANGR